MLGVYDSEQKLSRMMYLRTTEGKGRKEERPSIHLGSFDDKQQVLVRTSQMSLLGHVVGIIWFQP